VRELLFVGATAVATVFSPDVLLIPHFFAAVLIAMAAELVSHSQRALIRIGIGIARRQPLQQR